MDKRFLFYVTARDSDSFMKVIDHYYEVQNMYLTRARALAAWDAKKAVGDLHVQVKMTWTVTQTIFLFRFPLLAAFGFTRLDWFAVPVLGGYPPRAKVEILDRFRRLTRLYAVPYRDGGLAMACALCVRGLLPGGREAYDVFNQERINTWDASFEFATAAWYIRQAWEESVALNNIVKRKEEKNAKATV